MLTPRQSECLQFIVGYQTDHHGVSPSYDEIRDAVGLKSKSGIVRLMDMLTKRGFIRRTSDTHRAIEVLKVPEGLMIGSTSAERERCAQIVERWGGLMSTTSLAALIRKGLSIAEIEKLM